MNIVLIGYRGAGKTSVAKLLAERTKWPLVSTDVEIVKKAGMPVPRLLGNEAGTIFGMLNRRFANNSAKRSNDH